MPRASPGLDPQTRDQSLITTTISTGFAQLISVKPFATVLASVR